MSLSQSICTLYGVNEENGNHLYIHCPFTSRVWSFFLQGLSFYFMMSESLCNVSCQWGGSSRGMRGRMILKALLHRIICGIWKERNRRVLEDKKREVREMIDSILCEVGS